MVLPTVMGKHEAQSGESVTQGLTVQGSSLAGWPGKGPPANSSSD